MYGDSELIRRRVAQLREQGEEVRALADQLVARTESVTWSGRAATTMRERVSERAAGLRAAADQHDRAAHALARHLKGVDDAKEHIAEVEARATVLVADARARVAELTAANEADGVRREPAPEDEQLTRFTPPRPGHKDWLTVDLPGL